MRETVDVGFNQPMHSLVTLLLMTIILLILIILIIRGRGVTERGSTYPPGVRHQVQPEDQPLLEFPRYYLVSRTSVAQRSFCHFLLSSFVRKLPAASFRLRNWRVAIADSCSWAILAALLRMCVQVVLWWVTIPNNFHSS